jgi:catechol 2,3-dioxygenase-like lactoylglutathione lyase family enzyme
MGLSAARAMPVIAVSDLAKAREFYEEVLGLSGGEDEPDGGRTYPCADGTRMHIYPSPQNAGKSPATIATLEIDDIGKTVDELTASGVTFEQYDFPTLKTDDLATMGPEQAAWFKDPDGNILAVRQM